MTAATVGRPRQWPVEPRSAGHPAFLKPKRQPCLPRFPPENALCKDRLRSLFFHKKSTFVKKTMDKSCDTQGYFLHKNFSSSVIIPPAAKVALPQRPSVAQKKSGTARS
jgi:hypothetical protein